MNSYRWHYYVIDFVCFLAFMGVMLLAVVAVVPR